jgi:hypothetical protein
VSDEQIREALRELTKAPVQVKMATVLSVDLNGPSCSVQPENEAELLEVRLKAGVDGIQDGIIEVPSVDSTVLVGIVENDQDDAFVLKCSKVDKVIVTGLQEVKGKLKVESELEVDGEVKVNGGSNGGMVLIKVLLQKLNQLEVKMATHQHLVGPVPTLPDPATNTPLPLTQLVEIENPKVKH